MTTYLQNVGISQIQEAASSTQNPQKTLTTDSNRKNQINYQKKLLKQVKKKNFLEQNPYPKADHLSQDFEHSQNQQPETQNEGGDQDLNIKQEEDEQEIQTRVIKHAHRIEKYESDSVDEQNFLDYFEDPIKRKVFDQQRKRVQMKEMQNINGFSLNKFGIKSIKALRQAQPQSIEEDVQRDQEGAKNYATVSLFCLSVTNPFRNNIIYFTLVNPMFDRFILFVIASNCIFLALDKEVQILTDNGSTIDFVFLILYTCEMLLKIVAMGFCLREHSYLRNGWNILDFSVVFLGWLSLGINSGAMSGIKVVRTLRPLKAIKQIPDMPALVNTIMKSIPILVDVGVVFSFCLIFFATVGTQLLGGHLEGRCTAFNELGNSTIALGDDQVEIICFQQSQCDLQQPEGVNSTCLYYGNPAQGTYTFDTVPLALINSFLLINMAGWTDKMYTIRQVEQTYLYDIYFLGIVLSGNFIILNLMIAVQASFLDQAFDEDEAIQAEIDEKNARKKQIKSAQFAEEDRRALDESQFAEEEEEEQGATQNKRVKKKKPPGLFDNCSKPDLFILISDKSFELIMHPKFEETFIYSILFNTFCLCMDWYDCPQEVQAFTGYANYFFTVLFTFEMIFKLFGLGFKEYNKDRFNIFDAFIVIMSYVDALMPAGNEKLKVLKAFRTLRIFKIVKKWEQLRILLDTLAGSLTPIVNLGLLMGMYVFIGALMCKQFFGSLPLLCDDGTESRFSYNTTAQGLLTFYIFLSGDSWDDLMNQTIFTFKSELIAPFYMIQLVIGNLMLLNLFLGILLRSISDMPEPEETEQTEENEEDKKEGEEENKLEAPQEVQEALPGFNQVNMINEEGNGQENQLPLDKTPLSIENKIPSLALTNPDPQQLKAESEQSISQPSNLENEIDYMKEKLEIIATKMTNKLQEILDLSENSQNQRQIVNQIEALDLANITDLNIDRIKNEDDEESNKSSDSDKNKERCVTSEDSLFCLSPENRFRVILCYCFEHPYYDDFMYHMIGLNSVFLALDSPSLSDPFQNSTIDFMFNIISGIFVAECVLKIFAYGFYWGEKAYLKEAWNILDISIVFFSLLTWTLNAILDESQVSFIRGFRALRALRPLKIVSKNEKMKSVLNALIEAFPSLMNIMALFLMFILVFAILGIQILKGTQGNCNNDDPAILTRQDCQGNYTVDVTDNFGIVTGQEDIPMVWFVPVNAYDNIFQSMLSFFELSTMEQWPIPLFAAIDAVGYDQMPVKNNNPSMCLLYVIYIFVVSFFILNLFVSIIIDKFNDEIKKKQGSDKFSPQQIEWVKLQRLLVNNDPKIIPVEPINCGRLILFNLAQSQTFEYFVVTVIIISTIFLCMDYYGQSEEFGQILKNANMFFVVFFTCEGTLKMLAYGFSYYWYINWNKFDFVVVFLSLIVIDETWLVKLNVNVSALRIIRVMRLFRLIKVNEDLRNLLKTIIMSLPNIFTTALLLLLLLFTFSIVGMSLLGDQPYGENYNGDANFQTFYNSMFLLFRCSTGEGWNSIMHDTYTEKGMIGIIFWLAFVFACSLIFLKVFIAVIGESFNDNQQASNDSDILALKKKDIKAFKYTWAKYNPQGDHFMKTSLLQDFLRELPPPLGYLGIKIEPMQLRKIIFCLNIKDHEGKVYYPEVMWSIFHSIAGMNDENILKCEQVMGVVKEAKNKYKALGKGKKVNLDSLCGNVYLKKELTAIKWIYAEKIYRALQRRIKQKKQKAEKALQEIKGKEKHHQDDQQTNRKLLNNEHN